MPKNNVFDAEKRTLSEVDKFFQYVRLKAPHAEHTERTWWNRFAEWRDNGFVESFEKPEKHYATCIRGTGCLALTQNSCPCWCHE